MSIISPGYYNMVDQLAYFLEWTKRIGHIHDFCLLGITHSFHTGFSSYFIKESVGY